VSKLDATALKKEEIERDEISVRGEFELATTAVLYRYTPKKRDQIVRVTAMLSEHIGKKVSYSKMLDQAVDALETRLKRLKKKRENDINDDIN